MRPTLKRESPSDWVDFVSAALARCESEEMALAYGAGCESSRKSSGSYYTPVDAARFFWINYFAVNQIRDKASARSFISKFEFLEPSAGSGILFFALIESLGKIGLAVADFQSLSAHLVDVNLHATAFVSKQLDELRSCLGVKFLREVRVFNEDFFSWQAKFKCDRPVVCFGNPPFVAQTGLWRNSAAAFMDRCLPFVEAGGALSFIMPMSLCFSVDYRPLRGRIRSLDAECYFLNFDNIPDTLFKSGKPLSTNTNKANSQRCSIATVVSALRAKEFATRLLRWRAAERIALLSNKPSYVQVDSYALNDQFPRAQSKEMISYLSRQCLGSANLGDLLTEGGPHEVFVSGVARNYIGVRDEDGPGVIVLRTKTKSDYYRVLAIVTSKAFLEYWLTVGDGFHVTKGSLTAFPISKRVEEQVEDGLPHVRRMWRGRVAYAKAKLNRGKVIKSFDFSAAGLRIALMR